MGKSKDDYVEREEFTGWFIPADIVYLFQDDKITPHEMILLATIDSFVRRGKKGRGCYASNATLAKKCRFGNPMTVSNMIAKLKRMKLLRIISKPNQMRELDTAWSRVTRR